MRAQSHAGEVRNFDAVRGVIRRADLRSATIKTFQHIDRGQSAIAKLLNMVALVLKARFVDRSRAQDRRLGHL